LEVRKGGHEQVASGRNKAVTKGLPVSRTD
jgi:hypothetical protein